MQDSIVIKAEGITKKFGAKTILENIDLTVNRGQAVALVGENGCGKSTLIRIMAGLGRMTSGTVMVRPEEKMALIPDRFEKVSFTIPQFMKHMQMIEGGSVDEDILKVYYDKFYLKNMLDTPMKYLSKGTLQKVAVIQALISERNLLFMDEPLSGQDYMSQGNFVEDIINRKNNGMTVIMACHEPYLIEEIADDIFQIKDKHLVDGTQYLYEKRRPKSTFIVRNSDKMGEIIEILKQKYAENEKSLLINRQGKMVKIFSAQSLSPFIFKVLIENDAQIVKYEEI